MDLKEIFDDIEKHILQDKKPSIFLNEIKEKGYLNDEPFSLIKGLEKIDQSPKYHPEGSVWTHTMMVVDEGAKYREKVNDQKAFMWCLLLHDIGKLSTTRMRKGRLTSYDHDKVGESESKKFLDYFDCSEEFKAKVSKLIRYHMHLLFIMKKLPYADVEGLKKYVDINDIAYVFLSDRLGRGGVTESDEENLIREVKIFRNEYEKK